MLVLAVPAVPISIVAPPAPLHICHLTATLSSGGVEERIARLSRALDPKSFHTTWIGLAPPQHGLAERVGAATDLVQVARRTKRVEPELIARLVQVLRKTKPDVLHVHNWSTGLYGIAAGRLAGVPVIIYGEGGREDPALPSARRRALMQALAPHVDHFTAVCDFLGSEVQRDWGVPPSRVSTLRTGVTFHPPPDRDLWRRQHNLPQDAILVATVAGRFRPVKQISTLVDTFCRAAPQFPDAHLVLFGDPLGTEGELKARSRAFADRVHFFGHVPQVGQALAACDIAVNVSRFEGASNAVLEAMAAGLPVIATAVGGTPELVLDGLTGRLVHPYRPKAWDQAFVELLGSAALRARWGQAAQLRAKDLFGHDQMISAYIQLYQKVQPLRRGYLRAALDLGHSAAAATLGFWHF